MNVCATTLSKWGRPLHWLTRMLACSRGEQQQNRTYWRSDSINIYHNHKIKLFSKPIACDPIGGSVWSGRDHGLGPKQIESEQRKISLQFGSNCPGPESQYPRSDISGDHSGSGAHSNLWEHGIHLSKQRSRLDDLRWLRSRGDARFGHCRDFPYQHGFITFSVNFRQSLSTVP